MNVLSRHRTKSRALAGLVASAFLLAGVGRADSVPSQTRGTATIGFPFVAGSTQCPAGSYSFEAEGNKVTLRAVEPKGPTVILLVVTRLGRHDKDANPEFVFDKVGDQLKLSELWPSKQDGYLLLASTEPHEHRVVGGSNPHD